MKQALPHLALTPALSIPASERSIADLMDSFEVLLGTYQEAAGAGDENARDVARKALKDAHLSVLTELFVTHRSRHARTATNRAAGIDPAGPQPVGYVSPGELERLDADDQAFIDPPSCVAPKSIPLFAERPLSAAILADESMRSISDAPQSEAVECVRYGELVRVSGDRRACAKAATRRSHLPSSPEADAGTAT